MFCCFNSKSKDLVWDQYGGDFNEGILTENVKKGSCNYKPWLIGGGIVLGIIAIAGAITAAYFFSPMFSTLVNHTFSQIQNNQMTVAQGLLYIGVPIVGASLTIGIIVHLARKHHQSTNYKVLHEGKCKAFFNTLKPTRKQLIIASVALLAIVALGVACWLVPQYVPVVQQGLQHKLQIWQGLAYIGGGALSASFITGLALYLLIRRAEKKEDRELLKALF